MTSSILILILVALVVGLIGGVVTYTWYMKPMKSIIQQEKFLYESKYGSDAATKEKQKQQSPSMKIISDTIDKILPLTPEAMDDYRNKLQGAGLHEMSPAMWRAIKVLSVAIGAVLGLLIGALLPGIDAKISLLCVVFGVALGLMAPAAYLSSKRSARKKEIQATLPGAIELLSVMMSAGLPLEQGFKEIGDNAEGIGVVAEEFARVDREINAAGVDYCDALMDMAERCDSDDMRAFASSLVQARQQGSSVASILESQAVIVRKTYFDAIKEKINKTEAKISIPLGLFFLPAIIVASMAPTVANMMEVLPQVF